MFFILFGGEGLGFKWHRWTFLGMSFDFLLFVN